MATRLSADGRRLIQGFEGLSLKAYPDPPGDPQNRHSIGYGHSGAKPGDVISREEAERLFDADVLKYETAVALKTPVSTQPQFDAMTSLAYNIGTTGFRDSTVARLHNAGDYAGAADAFLLWVKAAGKEHPGLKARRQRERAVYLNGYGNPYLPPPPMTPAAPSSPPSSPPPLAAAPSSSASSSVVAAGVGGIALAGALLLALAALLARR
jgi:GH24 family phage-related lysozyme (muramidase)